MNVVDLDAKRTELRVLRNRVRELATALGELSKATDEALVDYAQHSSEGQIAVGGAEWNRALYDAGFEAGIHRAQVVGARVKRASWIEALEWVESHGFTSALHPGAITKKLDELRGGAK